jgi:hypothetical protein
MWKFGPLGNVAKVTTVQERINERFDQLFHYDRSGRRRALVCTFCDEYLLSSHDVNYLQIEHVKKNQDLFLWSNHITDPTELLELQPLVNAYTFDDVNNRVNPNDWLKGLCLSPRGVIGKSIGKTKFGFSCCTKCKKWITNGKLPFYSIINRNYVGYAPECLTSLDELELAFISPVKGYGYSLSWVGGAQKCLKGNLTFMRVEERSIAKAAAQLEGMGLTNHIVVLLNGKMTRAQRARARKPIRVTKVLLAVQWLCKNHQRWKHIDYSNYQQKLEQFVPKIYDHSTEVESTNQNVEQEELFLCYYPDGAVNHHQGGFNDPNDFKQFIDNMHQAGYDIQLKVDLAKQFVHGNDGDQLISSCLLQFPYGIGGLDEKRQLPDGTFTIKAYLEAFMGHLTLVSQKCFQYPMFQLIAYSLSSKLRLLRKSRFQVRDKMTASALANGLDFESVRATIHGRQAGNWHAGSVASRTLLSSVDSMSRALPHSNESAKQARSQGEAMQHVLSVLQAFF